MNTLLLSTNTTNCTTKNLKMMAAVICMTAVFVFTNSGVFAQSFSNSQGKASVVKKEITTKSTVDRNEAKRIWKEEHPNGNETKTTVAETKQETPVTNKNVASEKVVVNHAPVPAKKQTAAPVHIVTEYKGTPQKLNNADIKATPVTE
jgi:Mn-containing catalase